MDANHSNYEKGQAIVYLVLGIVVFLGFVALAIDGGMVLADRRHDQNVADAASLAGGGAAALHLAKNLGYTCDQQWTCANNSVINNAEVDARKEAVDRAGANGFTIDHNMADLNGVDFACNGTSWEDANITVTVDISATTPSNFLQVVFPDALHNEVEAVTYVDPGGPLEYGNAVVALNDAACSAPGSDGIVMGGSGDINVNGGDIFSNGCLRDNGGVTVTVTGGDPFGNDLTHITEENWDPQPIHTDTQDKTDAYNVPTPKIDSNFQCTDPAAHNVATKLPNGTLSGLYCVTSTQGLSINNNDDVIGDGVTIFVVRGPLTINGTPHIDISAPPQPPPDPSPAIPGILIYLPPSNSSPIIINGDSDSILEGVILAPKSSIQLNGNDKVMYDGQVIGWNVEITGNADFKMNYSGCNGYLQQPYIELYK